MNVFKSQTNIKIHINSQLVFVQFLALKIQTLQELFADMYT